MNAKPALYSGTSNIVLPIKRAAFPPQFSSASRLEYYGTLFSSLEINSSFTRIPKIATIEKWRDSVPGHFRFTFKVPKVISHAKSLQFSLDDVNHFAKTIAHIGDKKGCLLLQLPPSTKSELQKELNSILKHLSKAAKGWKIAVEFRHISWYQEEIYSLLQEYGAALVEQDLPASATPPVRLAADFCYQRFHGTERGYRGSYDDNILVRYAKRIAQAINKGREAYVYFNNTLGDAAANLQTFNKMVKARLQH